MVTVKLPIFDPVQEDFLRYTFNSWGGNIKISLTKMIGQSVYSAVFPSYQKPEYKQGQKYLTLEIPKHESFQFERYPYHYISLRDAQRIRMELMSAYYTDMKLVVVWGRYRGLNFKESILKFIDGLALHSGDYKLHINYEQVRKMMTREERRLRELLNSHNQRSVYKTVI